MKAYKDETVIHDIILPIAESILGKIEITFGQLNYWEEISAVFGLMSLKSSMVRDIRQKSESELEKQIEQRQGRIKEKKKELSDFEEKLFSLEEKWISNQISHDTYNRWYCNLNDKCLELKAAIERLNINHTKAFRTLSSELDLLTDMRYVYTSSNTIGKQQIVNMVFDSNLYYKEGIYRTPTMMDIFTHNTQIMSEKGLLIYEKKRDSLKTIPLSGESGIRTRGTVSSTTV